jgi:O-antigen/teichoic acid export membrane protein
VLSGLVRNTAVSAVAYTAVAAVNLLLVSVLVGAYGLEAYGLLVVSRVFLPSGFAIADFGLSETATVIVARARAAGAWLSASRQITWLLGLSLVIAVVLGALLLAVSSAMAGWLHVAEELRPEFVRLTRITAASLLVFYPALLLEGMIKGYERYTLLRALEVVTTIAYAVGAVLAIRYGYSYVAVAYLFLASTAAKYVVLAICAVPLFRHIALRFAWSDVESRRVVWQRSTLMVHNKVLGALQTQLPPLAIGLIVGAAGAGMYDVLTRVPRAVKSVLALLTAALLPISARLDASGDHDRLRALGSAGFSMVPAIAFPALVGLAVFSPELLRVWLGPDLVSYWPWLAMMFAVPALNTVLTFGHTMMQVRPGFLAANNRITTVQIAAQYGVALALTPWLRERAFIAGQVASVLLAFPAQLRLQLDEQGIGRGAVYTVLGKHAAIAAMLAGTMAIMKRNDAIQSAGTLLASYLVWCTAYWAMSYMLTLSRSDRVHVHRVVRAALGSGAPS